mmetsp:Transcript_102899/g.286572  ORF Transcript_102899/g.286572 Transcript_102899/m.286572 type:complete len:490 (-) Transcript_102899:190-1659(-)
MAVPLRVVASVVLCSLRASSVYTGTPHLWTPRPHDPAKGTPAGLKEDDAPQAPDPLPERVASSGKAASVDKVQPQLFFLFLVYIKINNEAVWDRFFSSAVRGIDYQALVHCKSEASCKTNIKSLHRFEIISPVETQYCFNLVSGMNALLKAALLRAGMGNGLDKFIFVSDSTLPVKPFRFVYDQLTADTASDFCIFPRNEWAAVSETFLNNPMHSPQTRVAVKHHQWIVLSRNHAEESVRHEGEHQNLMKDFQLNMGFQNTGCLDEFWHFLVLFSSLNLTGRPMSIHLQGFHGGPLSTSDTEVQGHCDTFVHWVPRASGVSNNATRLASSLLSDPGTDMVPASETRPASLGRLSRTALEKLRKSPFLFARKIEDECGFSGCESLAEAFDSLVFATPPRPLQSSETMWRGQGVWLDTQHAPVSITSQDGSVTLVGRDDSMHAKGSFCRDHISVVFSNGFKAKASLSADGRQLHWHNGVVWGRALAGGGAA